VVVARFGQFSHLWVDMAQRLGLDVIVQDEEWGTGADPQKIEEALRADKDHAIKAVMIVHNETATYSCAECYAYQAATVAAGTETGLAKGKTVGVVIHGDIHAETPGNKIFKMHLAPRRDIGGVVHYAAHRVDKSGNSDADAIDIGCHVALDQRCKRFKHYILTFSRRARHNFFSNDSIPGNEPDTHVGSPEVNA